VYTKNDIAAVAEKISALAGTYAVFTFTGSLGAGKTTLISAVCKQLGVVDQVTSPTFTYMHVYSADRGKTIYHFDLYRINSIDDFLNAGFQEYFYQPHSIVFVEWPEHIMPLIDHSVCHVDIDYKDEDARILRYSITGKNKKNG